ncbi:hypothetical protein RHMOL_Rhmol05G0135600 [Rhododendron molle]|uniref:Uncharacterized protein n=1 Tax=Rhododendron molle TaxID=49168 RepID=A0ACC0NNJ6_RHOML|nr:hypothetical protein RHMOL_Rhmol05G0135600 [Rhododendron molle]
MALRDILADLEKRKKKRQKEERAKAAAKSGPSARGPTTKTSRPIGLKKPPPSSLLATTRSNRASPCRGKEGNGEGDERKDGNRKKKAFDERYAKGYSKAEDDVVDQVEKAEVQFKQ